MIPLLYMHCEKRERSEISAPSTPATVWRRSGQEGWKEQREAASEKLIEKVREKVVYSQSEQLAACNAREIEIAVKLESAVKQRLERAAELSENALRNLSVVLESSQRVSRLASGASTENLHSDPYAQMTDQELAAELQRMGIEPAEPTLQ